MRRGGRGWCSSPRRPGRGPRWCSLLDLEGDDPGRTRKRVRRRGGRCGRNANAVRAARAATATAAGRRKSEHPGDPSSRPGARGPATQPVHDRPHRRRSRSTRRRKAELVDDIPVATEEALGVRRGFPRRRRVEHEDVDEFPDLRPPSLLERVCSSVCRSPSRAPRRRRGRRGSTVERSAAHRRARRLGRGLVLAGHQEQGSGDLEVLAAAPRAGETRSTGGGHSRR